jgi:hypothetical protein
VAEIVTFCVDETAEVVIVKLVLVVPAATVTLAGVDATDVLLLESTTTTELEGALDRLTVPCVFDPPATLLGLTVSEETVIGAGFTVSVAYWVTPAEAAEMVAV